MSIKIPTETEFKNWFVIQFEIPDMESAEVILNNLIITSPKIYHFLRDEANKHIIHDPSVIDKLQYTK